MPIEPRTPALPVPPRDADGVVRWAADFSRSVAAEIRLTRERATSGLTAGGHTHDKLTTASLRTLTLSDSGAGTQLVNSVSELFFPGDTLFTGSMAGGSGATIDATAFFNITHTITALSLTDQSALKFTVLTNPASTTLGSYHGLAGQLSILGDGADHPSTWPNSAVKGLTAYQHDAGTTVALGYSVSGSLIHTTASTVAFHGIFGGARPLLLIGTAITEAAVFHAKSDVFTPLISGTNPVTEWGVYSELNNHLEQYTDIVQIATPGANPAAGTRRLYVNSGTGEISVLDSGGGVTSLESGGFTPDADPGADHSNYVAGGDGTDGTAIHDDTADEIHQVTAKGTPVAADEILIEDSAAAWAKKRIALTDLLGAGGGGDEVLIKGTNVIAALGIDFLAGTGVTITHAAGPNPETATLAFDTTVAYTLLPAGDGTITIQHAAAGSPALDLQNTGTGDSPRMKMRSATSLHSLDFYYENVSSGTVVWAKTGEALGMRFRAGSVVGSRNLTVESGDVIATVGDFIATAGNLQANATGQSEIARGLVVNQGGGGADTTYDFRVESLNEPNMIFLDASADVLRFGDGTANYAQFAADGSLTFVGTASFTLPADSVMHNLFGFTGAQTAVVKGTTVYLGFGSGHQGAPEAAAQYKMARSGTLRNFRVYVSASNTDATSTITVRKNGVATGIAVTYTSGATGQASNGGTESVVLNDLISVEADNPSIGGGNRSLTVDTVQLEVTT